MILSEKGKVHSRKIVSLYFHLKNGRESCEIEQLFTSCLALGVTCLSLVSVSLLFVWTPGASGAPPSLSLMTPISFQLSALYRALCHLSLSRALGPDCEAELRSRSRASTRPEPEPAGLRSPMADTKMIISGSPETLIKWTSDSALALRCLTAWAKPWCWRSWCVYPVILTKFHSN